jgi:uncharacterized protein
MLPVFADTSYWVALLYLRDHWHALAVEVSESLGPRRVMTTQEVLMEVMNFFSEYGPMLRREASQLVQKTIRNPNVTVLPQTQDSFHSGLNLYENRPDKGYSMTDCISMEQMRAHQITEVLTTDRHFEQEGFQVLLKPSAP